MQEQVQKRLTELEAEYRAGQEMFADLEAKRADLQQTLLRISGAIQVLKEILEPEPDPAVNGAAAPQPGTLPPDQDSPGQDSPAASSSLVAG
ncbi:MAG: hypothetical protein ACRDTC_09655 [Pseudonocardiaceae bacterium]